MHTLADSSYMITCRLDDNTTIEIETRRGGYFDDRGRCRSYNIGFTRVSQSMSEFLKNQICFIKRFDVNEFVCLQTFRLCTIS